MSGSIYRRVTACRVCGGTGFDPVVDLGETPLANAFVPPEGDRTEPRIPLEAVRCTACGLVQLSVVVRPDVLFRSYVYTTSSSAPMRAHFEALAELVARQVVPGSLVVEVGSNDGVLLRPLAGHGLRPVGVEPATNLAAAANAAGLETWNEFFSSGVAGRLRSERGPAAAVLANNVLAHIDDVADVMRGLDALLAPDGVFIAEVPYLADLLDHVEYDTIYHEHLSYFHLAPLGRLLVSAGLELVDVERLGVHGGSVRIFASRRGRRARTRALEDALSAERVAEMDGPRPYRSFASRVAASREALRGTLEGLRDRGMRVAAIGATAKGNTMLNYCGISTDLVGWIADSTPLKQGLLSPGMHIPVRSEGTIRSERPDRTLLLAWNYADDIVRRFADYIAAGGRFIHPIPLAREIP
jgi:novobiocin biosynthesis protein NovU/D-mycarose 3-C-methyltransferase